MGDTINFGLTILSNSFSDKYFNLIALSFKEILSCNAFFAISADFSYPIFGTSAVTTSLSVIGTGYDGTANTSGTNTNMTQIDVCADNINALNISMPELTVEATGCNIWVLQKEVLSCYSW